MEPVFTIPYPEYCVANHLQELFPASQGYAVFVPASRQQRGVDLLLMRRASGRTRALTIQVKSSRTYSPKPTKTPAPKRFRFYTWFKVFDVPEEADYTFLVALYPPEEARTTKRLASWWAACILVFSREEMAKFLRNVRTKAGTPDRMFGFGFDDAFEVIQTRGDHRGRLLDFSRHLLANRVDQIRQQLAIT